MRICFAFMAVLLLTSVGVSAQDAAKTDVTAPAIIKPSRDFVMLQMGYNTWITKPDSIKTKTVGLAFNAFLCYDFPIKNTKLSFATGLGINASIVYLNQMVMSLKDTGSLGSQVRFLPDTMIDQRYSKYKFATTYLTAPFELRYFSNSSNRNKGFKAAIGMQVGTLLGAHTKGVKTISNTTIKDKVDTKRYLSPWNFAVTARVGWGNFSLYGSYNLTNVFKDNAGPALTPMSIGICLTGL